MVEANIKEDKAHEKRMNKLKLEELKARK